MRTQLGALGLLLALGGCGEDQATYRHRDPARMTQAQFQRDDYECDRENTHQEVSTVFGKIVSSAEVDRRMAERCLQARGWYRVK